MYQLTALSGDPLEDLRTSTAPNKAQLIQARTTILHLDVPPYLRYFIWIAGVGKCFIGQCDLGVTVQNQPVTVLLAQAAGSTLQLVTISNIIAIILGLIIGITTALRQYSGYDYGVTIFQFPSVTAFDPNAISGIAPSTLAPTIFWNIWDWQPGKATP